ncbi:Uu.00g075890.m01.CDS01 [Anthostomella pinea]|uniref:Uu.00g075890.m01.CDS01 n=1 Tax=Anthostomella pinea TaxID=933095 RepID=A0AAI8VVR9_9PEZI|nr:Uu.00g075890.m01.CDS01 [Anthostomella pinea]
MEPPRTGSNGDTLVSAIEKAATKAFQPTADPVSRSEGQHEFGALISRTGTSALITTLNVLMKPDRVPGWLRIHLMDVLTLLPQRPDGIRATLEFVFSVHPSSTLRASEAATTQKQGANITMEALKMASILLSVPPASVSPADWFPGIAPQLLRLLDGNDGADLVKVASYVIGFGILGRKQFGAPGTPGWKAFAETMLAGIDPSLSTEASTTEPLVFSAGPDEVVDLRKQAVLVKEDDLHAALTRLAALLNSHPNPGLTKRLLAPLMLPLWALSSWTSKDEGLKQRYSRPAQILLEIFLKLAGSPEKFQELLENLLFNGAVGSSKIQWAYELVGESGLQVKRVWDSTDAGNAELDLPAIESKTDAFVDLLRRLGSDLDISTLFLDLFQSSLAPQGDADKIKIVDDDGHDADPVAQLIKARVLQQMIETLPDRLISDSKHLLELVSKILGELKESSLGDDATAIALSLLNIVVTTPNFQRSDADASVLTSIESSLDKISKAENPETSQTAHNLSLLLKYRDAMDDPADRPITPSARQVEDRKTYQLAISYITQADSPPPVRSEGLNLLATLIKANSAILDIPATLVLLSSLLNEDDDYINLRVMQTLTLMATRHPKSTTKEILEHYVDADEHEKTDTRLRFGEALLQVIQRLGETFAGKTATQVGEALLAVASRRGHRPKTEVKQERAARLEAHKHNAAKAAWDDALPDLSEDLADELPNEHDRARNEILAQIVSGWESKRGSVDVRVRASALSLFAAGIDTNVAGYGATLVEGAVDLCVGILTLETGPETAILRRAAILLILAFVRALASAREQGRSLGFGLLEGSRVEIVRVLEYVAQTDGDGLVQEHARDVVESLENWRLMEVLPTAAERGGLGEGPALTRLAGLDIGIGSRPSLPALATPGQEQARPRIEEIE